MPRADWDFLSLHKISFPPLEEQARIAGALRALDDKIELNRRMAGTLEEMAQALFKAWFVDFEPVRAKMEGRWQPGESLPGLPAHLYDLFPDTLVDSELGPIPSGWPVVELGHIAQSTSGRSYRSAELGDSNVALVTLRSFARDGGYRIGGLKPYTGKFRPEQAVSAGETVVACTDVSQDAVVIGRSARIPTVERFTCLVASLDALILRPRVEVEYSRSWINLLSQTTQFVDYLKAHSSGTTVLHLDKSAVLEFPLPLPEPRLALAFESLAAPLLSSADLIAARVRRLVQLREAVLPKLISGEIRLPEEEGMLGF